MRVRQAVCADAAGIARVHVDSWRTTYRGIVPQDYLDGLTYAERQARWERGLCMSDPEPCVYVAEDGNGQIVGFANGGPERSGDPVYRGEIYAIYILQPQQRQGLGRELVRKVVEALQKMGFQSMLVWVLADNPSRRFYEALGGEPVRTQEISIGGTPLEEVAYGWQALQLTFGPDRGVGLK
jgi:GNAT superfamily N-acetyltransferase